MNTTLKDLNDYLFEELERLNDDENLDKQDNFIKEIERTKVITNISQRVISIADIQLKAIKLQNEFNIDKKTMPKLLTGIEDETE